MEHRDDGPHGGEGTEETPERVIRKHEAQRMAGTENPETVDQEIRNAGFCKEGRALEQETNDEQEEIGCQGPKGPMLPHAAEADPEECRGRLEDKDPNGCMIRLPIKDKEKEKTKKQGENRERIEA